MSWNKWMKSSPQPDRNGGVWVTTGVLYRQVPDNAGTGAQGCGVGVVELELELESKGILGGAGVSKNVLTPTPTSI
jgi:hypothetical protein